MFALLTLFLSSPSVYTLPETVIVSSPVPSVTHVRTPAKAGQSTWHCGAPRELIQGSGTVRTCEEGGGS